MRKQNSRYYVAELSTLALLAAMACVLVLFTIPFPLFPAFKYDFADIPIFVATFAFGPVAGILVTVVVSLIQAFALGQDGLMGFMMHVLATGAFVVVAGLIYKHKKTKKSAAIALIFGTLTMTVVMCLANYVLDPIFYGMPQAAVAKLIIPAVLPFNLSKAGINSLITFFIYKSISKLIHKAEGPAEEINENDQDKK